MAGLLPCPICGDARVPKVSDVGECEECRDFDVCSYRQENHYSCEGCSEWEKPMFVVCDCSAGGCGTSGPYRRTATEAIEAWNTRYHCGLSDEDYSILLDELGVSERTCQVLGEDYDELLEYWETELSCGHVFNGMAEYVDYCPKCGAKVVRE